MPVFCSGVSHCVKIVFSQILVVVFWYWSFAAEDLGCVCFFLAPGWSCAVLQVRYCETHGKTYTGSDSVVCSQDCRPVWHSDVDPTLQGTEGVRVNQLWHQGVNFFPLLGYSVILYSINLGIHGQGITLHGKEITLMKESSCCWSLIYWVIQCHIASLFLSHSPLSDHCLWLNRIFSQLMSKYLLHSECILAGIIGSWVSLLQVHVLRVLSTSLSPIFSFYSFQAPDKDPAATTHEFLLISLRRLALPLVSYKDVLFAVCLWRGFSYRCLAAF